MRIAFALVGVLLLTGCVETVKFSSLAPSADNVARALAAERNLAHPQTVALRQYSSDEGRRLSVCLKSGGMARQLADVRLENNRVCGTPIVPGATQVEPRVCYEFETLQSIGLPRDAHTFGYYPVRGWMKCQGET